MGQDGGIQEECLRDTNRTELLLGMSELIGSHNNVELNINLVKVYERSWLGGRELWMVGGDVRGKHIFYSKKSINNSLNLENNFCISTLFSNVVANSRRNSFKS